VDCLREPAPASHTFINIPTEATSHTPMLTSSCITLINIPTDCNFMRCSSVLEPNYSQVILNSKPYTTAAVTELENIFPSATNTICTGPQCQHSRTACRTVRETSHNYCTRHAQECNSRWEFKRMTPKNDSVSFVLSSHFRLVRKIKF
jgi:hypothetical protein